MEENHDEDEVVVVDAPVEGDEEPQSSPTKDDEDEEMQAVNPPQTEETPSTGLDTAESAPESGPGDERVEPPSTEIPSSPTSNNSKHDVEFAGRDAAEEQITHDELKLTRKSMQVSGKSELTSPLAWKRKSILRKASSLAPSTRGTTRKVSFAPTDKVDIIVESSQAESTQSDPSPEKAPQTPRDESKSAGAESTPGPEAKLASVSTPEAYVLSSISPANAVSKNETEEQRRKREFEENVAREAQKLRAAAKLSAQKRLEEAKASKAFWAKRDQLKAKLRASSAGDKKAQARTPIASSSERVAVDHVSPPTSESSATTRERDSTPASASRQATSASKEVAQLPQSGATSTVQDVEEAKDYDFMRSMARHNEVESISDVSSALDSSLRDSKTPRSTFSVVVEEHLVERPLRDRLADKLAARSMPATASVTKEPADRPTQRASVERSQQDPPVFEPPFLSSKTLFGATKKLDSPRAQTAEALANRNRSDSLSSTVSSIPEPSVVENALTSGAPATTAGTRRPISNLVSGLHSFTTLLEKDTSSQDSNSGRSAPVVNALKLAERSRLLEEQKQQEKEKRKAL